MCIVCSRLPADRRIIATSYGASTDDILSRTPELTSRFGLGLTDENLAAGAEFLRSVPTIDVHSHPGRFFLNGLEERSPLTDTLKPMSMDMAIREMNSGGVGTVLFAAVADYPLLEASGRGLRAVRAFRPGEAIAEYHRQLGVLEGLVGEDSLPQVRDARDIERVHTRGLAACMFCIEGGDYIEDRLERVAQSYDRGVRAITLIHYHTNQIGDTQTESPSHAGLTDIGREIVREMQRVGIIVDLAHASWETTRDVARISTRPMLISHTNLRTSPEGHPRLISEEHARLVTDAGGVIGAVAAGFGQGSLSEYLDTILRMVDSLGVEHVAVGTDLDFTYQPVFTTYLDWCALPAGLLARGMNRAEVASVMGGNFLRVLRANAPRASTQRYPHEL